MITTSAPVWASSASVVKVRSRSSSARKREMSSSWIGLSPRRSRSTRGASRSRPTTVLWRASSTAMDRPTYPRPATEIFAVTPSVCRRAGGGRHAEHLGGPLRMTPSLPRGRSAAVARVAGDDHVEALAGPVGGEAAVAVARAHDQVVGVAGAGRRAVDDVGLAHRRGDLAGELRVGVGAARAAVGDRVAVLVDGVLQGHDREDAVVRQVLAGVDVDVAVGTQT